MEGQTLSARAHSVRPLHLLFTATYPFPGQGRLEARDTYCGSPAKIELKMGLDAAFVFGFFFFELPLFFEAVLWLFFLFLLALVFFSFVAHVYSSVFWM